MSEQSTGMGLANPEAFSQLEKADGITELNSKPKVQSEADFMDTFFGNSEPMGFVPEKETPVFTASQEAEHMEEFNKTSDSVLLAGANAHILELREENARLRNAGGNQTASKNEEYLAKVLRDIILKDVQKIIDNDGNVKVANIIAKKTITNIHMTLDELGL